ncbi:hypothetical protein Ancab_039176 [Ancistrocladus abbreviatus]
MENISYQIQKSGFEVGIIGLGPDASYGLAQLYSDLFLLDYYVLRYAEVRIAAPQCFPAIEGRLFLDGCFVRAENYSFFDDYKGPKDSFACLQSASSIQGCLCSYEGCALYTGRFMRYSSVIFLNKEPRKSLNGIVVAIVVRDVSALVVLTIVAAVLAYLSKRKMRQNKRKGSSDSRNLVKILHNSSLNFQNSILEKATRSFAETNKLGQGGIGTVNKAICLSH